MQKKSLELSWRMVVAFQLPQILSLLPEMETIFVCFCFYISTHFIVNLAEWGYLLVELNAAAAAYRTQKSQIPVTTSLDTLTLVSNRPRDQIKNKDLIFFTGLFLFCFYLPNHFLLTGLSFPEEVGVKPSQSDNFCLFHWL